MFVDDRTRIQHMLEAAVKSQDNVKGLSREDLDNDENWAIVLVHWIQVMGEAARRVSPGLKVAHPEVEWSKIQGMRHRIVHDYTEIDLNIIWTVVTGEVKVLVEQLKAVLRELEEKDGK